MIERLVAQGERHPTIAGQAGRGAVRPLANTQDIGERAATPIDVHNFDGARRADQLLESVDVECPAEHGFEIAP